MSSSGHIALVPELLRWDYGRLDPELRKSFEVALHAGTAAALLLALRGDVAGVVRSLDGRRIAGVALAFLPPAAAAFAFERPIERRLGSPRSVAAVQVVAGVALGLADRRPVLRGELAAGAVDHAAIGIGQMAALAPGVSRNGATLTALRLRRFHRRAANRLSRHAALPIIVAATALKGLRLARRGLPRGLRACFVAGAGAAFASTLACTRMIERMDGAHSYFPFAAYRVVLGAVAVWRLSATRYPPSSGEARAKPGMASL